MAYCAKADLEAAFGTNRIASWSDNDDAAIQHAIDTAQGEIDGYLISGGYAVPIDPVPTNVTKYAVDLAVYNLLTAKGLQDSAGDKAIVDRAAVARMYFEKVATGRFRIPQPTEAAPDEARPSHAVARVSAPARLDLSRYR